MINDMNDELAKAGAYNALKKKQVAAWADLRNNAAHKPVRVGDLLHQRRAKQDEFRRTAVDVHRHGPATGTADDDLGLMLVELSLGSLDGQREVVVVEGGVDDFVAVILSVAPLATLAHEMAHQWQHEFGHPPRSNYHNREWGTKMKEIGLYPSNTGESGGKETGQSMTHYVIDGGAFQEAFRAMPEAFKIPWSSGSIHKPAKRKEKNKLKYTCPKLTPYVEIDDNGDKHLVTGKEVIAALK
jgi:hypothetical protein